MRKTEKRIMRILLSMVLLVTCNGPLTPHRENHQIFDAKEVELQGYLEKGPFLAGSVIRIYELDRQWKPVSALPLCTTLTKDNAGSFSVKTLITTPHVLIEGCGYYFNEVTATISSEKLTLQAIANVNDAKTFNVNVLTTMAVKRLPYLVEKEGYTFEVALEKTAEDLYRSFTGMNPVTEKPELNTSLTKSGNRGGFLLYASALCQWGRNVRGLSHLLDIIQHEIEYDGRFSWEQFADAGEPDLQRVEVNLQNRYDELKIPVTVPDIHMYALSSMKHDYDGAGGMALTSIPLPESNIIGKRGNGSQFSSDVTFFLSTSLTDADIYYCIVPHTAGGVNNPVQPEPSEKDFTQYTGYFSLRGPETDYVVLAYTKVNIYQNLGDSTDVIEPLFLRSNIWSENLSIRYPVLTAPTFSHASGTYSDTFGVVLNGNENGAIYYTTNGTAPTRLSLKYDGVPIAINRIGSVITIAAFTIADGFAPSPVVWSSYSIDTSAVDSFSKDITFNDTLLGCINHHLTGTWTGRMNCAWRSGVQVEFTFKNNGTYTSRALEGSTPALFWGVDTVSELSTFSIWNMFMTGEAVGTLRYFTGNGEVNGASITNLKFQGEDFDGLAFEINIGENAPLRYSFVKTSDNPAVKNTKM